MCCKRSCKIKKKREQKHLLKKNDWHFKGVYKITCYKKVQLFSVFFFHWLLYECFFAFFIKAFVNFEKLIRFHRQAFIRYKYGENLKILKEVFHQKLIVSNVILPFQTIWNLKLSSSSNHGGRHRAPSHASSYVCNLKILKNLSYLYKVFSRRKTAYDCGYRMTSSIVNTVKETCSRWYSSQFKKFEKAWARVEILCLDFWKSPSIKLKYKIEQSDKLRNLWDFF